MEIVLILKFGGMNSPITLQWILLVSFGIIFWFLAPRAKTIATFFSAASKSGNSPGVWMLMSSLVISWIFAKSITNAANLGLDFGLVGGVAYGMYYVSFIVAGVVIYQLRTKGGFKSIHHFLQTKFGRGAVIVFSILIGFRLFNEVWSNTMVIGSYFGEQGSSSYFLAILVFTILTLAYTLKGGLRSSLITDAIQMVLFGLLLFMILGMIIPSSQQPINTYMSSGSWTMAGGLNLMLAAFLQSFSYPFHDSVLTDRGFISTPSVTLKAYFGASVVGFVSIVLFSLVGVYAGFEGLKGQAAVEVSKILPVAGMLMINFIMVTSAASTLDSAFSSFSKLVVIDLGSEINITISKGQLAMVGLTILGTIPIFFNPEILSATTISGTMVMGLAPIFLLWFMKGNKWSFHLAVLPGVFIGLCLAMGCWPTQLLFTSGKYADLLSANIYGLVLCFVLFFIPRIFAPKSA